jgi:hypothetical protein
MLSLHLRAYPVHQQSVQQSARHRGRLIQARLLLMTEPITRQMVGTYTSLLVQSMCQSVVYLAPGKLAPLRLKLKRLSLSLVWRLPGQLVAYQSACPESLASLVLKLLALLVQ